MTLYDPGLQPERTLLAWRRTCLALGLGTAVAVRFTAEVIGALSLVVAAAGVVLTALAYGGAWLRYRRASASLVSSGRTETDARPLVALAAAGVLLGGACLLFVLGRGLAS